MSVMFFILFCSSPGRNQCSCVRERSTLDDNILRWSYQVCHLLCCLALILIDTSIHFPDSNEELREEQEWGSWVAVFFPHVHSNPDPFSYIRSTGEKFCLFLSDLSIFWSFWWLFSFWKPRICHTPSEKWSILSNNLLHDLEEGNFLLRQRQSCQNSFKNYRQAVSMTFHCLAKLAALSKQIMVNQCSFLLARSCFQFLCKKMTLNYCLCSGLQNLIIVVY